MTGNQTCRGVEIDPALLQDADVDMLQDLVLTAAPDEPRAEAVVDSFPAAAALALDLLAAVPA